MKPTFPNLVRATASAAGVTKATAEAVLRRFFDELGNAVWATGRVNVPGLGAFRVRRRKKRTVGDPDVRGQSWDVPGHRVVFARVAASWRRR